MTNTFDIETHARTFQDKGPDDVLRFAYRKFDNIAISFSGAEDVVLVDMASRINPDIQVFSLDTGRLHTETYRFLEQVRERYDIRLDVLSPDSAQLETFVREKGLYSFYRDGHKECCGVRKIVPLRRKLLTVDAWITGSAKTRVRPGRMCP